MAIQKVGIDVGIQADGLTQFYRDLEAMNKDLAKGLLADMKEACKPILDSAVSNASFSKKIPGTIRLVATGGSRGSATISIRAGGAKAPNAAPLENKGNSGQFRHPVFGNKNNWVSQEAHPYMYPAISKDIDAVGEKLADSLVADFNGHNL